MNKPLWHLLAMHFREFFREPEILFWTMGFPIMLTLILGIAFSRKDMAVQHVGVVIRQEETRLQAPFQTWVKSMQTQARQRAALKQSDPGTPLIDIKMYPTVGQALLGIKRGDILLFVTYDQDKQQRIYHFDPQKDDAHLLYHLMEKGHTDRHRPEYLSAPGSRYIDFLIPGLIAFGILQGCMWGMAWGLIDRRIKKMLRRMVATPMNRYVFLSSYVLARIILSAVEISVLTFFAILTFHIQVQGSFLAFLWLFLCGNISFCGIAVLTASRAKNTQVGNGLVNAVVLPMMILSGIFFSYKNFPAWAISFIEKLPLTLLADAMRKVFIEGAGLIDVAVPSLWLLGIGILCFWVGQKIFRWY